MAFNNEGYNLLAREMQKRMQVVGDTPPMLDYGEILGDMSLQLNQFPLPIPQTDYFVCRALTMGRTGDILAKTQEMGKPHSGAHIHQTVNLTCQDGAVTGTVGTATGPAPDPPSPPASAAGGDSSDGAHQHHVLIPETMRWLQPGDRVLCVWVGSDVAVIDIILPATTIS